MAARPVFLIDVDDTLLDNDRFEQELGDRLTNLFGAAANDAYWADLKRLQDDTGYVDYLATLQRLRQHVGHVPALLRMSQWFLEYPFAERLYPKALEVVARLASIGTPVILSDGDVVFQPRKIQRSGIWDAVAGEVLIYVHKQNEIEAIRKLYPAPHYVLVDDKINILADMKAALGAELTTVFARQGHHAAKAAGASFKPELAADRIGELLDVDWEALLQR